ncbi:MAG: hypothetical protein L0Y80_03570 [Ignavibacteriae bacterium]|nr:hypothetical protein [Ignavibacteriota bacterium]
MSNPSNLRFLKIPLATVVLFSLVCTQIPLFNYLGFEFSALAALVLGFIAGIATISLWNKHTPAQPDIPLDEEGFWRYLKSVASALLLLSMLPALVMSANAALIKNCSFSQGLIFYGLLVVPGVAFCSLLALLISVSSFKWKKTWFTLAYLLTLLHIAFVTFTRPQIYAFNPIIGFFPGITYDETMQIEGRLLLYRWATVSASLLLFIVAVVLHRSRTRAKVIRDGQAGSSHKTWHVTELAGAMLLTAIIVGVFIFSSRLGLSSPRSYVEEELGGKIETQHFVLHYPASAVDERRARQLAKLHEFYFTGIVSELNIVSVKKIQSFIYASAEQKARLIGAGRTNIAKPWLWQMHLNLGDVESSLKHEMVHVLAADFGFPLIRVGLNPGLIEGLATAIERVQYEEPLHCVAAQIRSVGINPRMEQLFSFTGFAGTYSGVSYTLAGSFSRYLIDQYGVRRFKRLYRTGDFHAIYNKDISVLLAEWRRFLEKYEVDAREQLRAAYYFKRTSIFGKECARVIANIDAETRQHFARKEYALAYESATRSLDLSWSPGAVSSSVNSLVRLGKFSEAAELAEEYLGDSALAHTLLPLKLQLGDAYWASGDIARARLLYEELLSTHISLSMDEGAALRLEALKDTGLAAAVLPYFTGALSDTTRISMLRASLRVPVRKDIATYLLAREYASQGDRHRAIELFRSVERLPREVLEFQRQLRLARMYYSLGEYQRAKIHFWQSYNYTTSESFLYRIREWIELCNWMIDPPREMFKDEGGELQALWE